MKTIGWSCGALALALVGCAVTEGDTSSAVVDEGRRLFEHETFDGNGRTCATCHGKATGTVSPAEAQARFAADPDDPLFRPIDSDDGAGTSYTRLLTDATIRVTLPLPAGWRLADDPTATTVTVRRAIPSTLNVPALDPILMADGRNTSLQEQAHGAIDAHYEPDRQPTAAELDLIAGHQVTKHFFSSKTLRDYADGGPAPTLPPGHSPAQKRGRKWFVRSAAGICSHCHAGPMLNETSEFLQPPPGVIVPPGSRFFTAFVSELNKANAPVRTFIVTGPGGAETIVQSPDPGLALITGDPGTANLFRIPTLWGSAKTGPWFHDNSAKTLADLAQHYSDYFTIVLGTGLTAQDQADIIAYMKLLD